MPKVGRTDKEWHAVMTKFALHNYAFRSGGCLPGGKWKVILTEIKECPLYKATVNGRVGHTLFNMAPPQCKCNYKHTVETPTITTTETSFVDLCVRVCVCHQ